MMMVLKSGVSCCLPIAAHVKCSRMWINYSNHFSASSLLGTLSRATTAHRTETYVIRVSTCTKSPDAARRPTPFHCRVRVWYLFSVFFFHLRSTFFSNAIVIYSVPHANVFNAFFRFSLAGGSSPYECNIQMIEWSSRARGRRITHTPTHTPHGIRDDRKWVKFFKLRTEKWLIVAWLRCTAKLIHYSLANEEKMTFRHIQAKLQAVMWKSELETTAYSMLWYSQNSATIHWLRE